jgi:hypothetical protein
VTATIRAILAAPVAAACVAAILSAQPRVVVRMQPPSIAAGQMTTAMVTAPAGATVVVRTDAPGVPPQTSVGTGTEQSVRLGPFINTGDFQVTASAGAQSSAAAVRVAFPQDAATPAPLGESSTAYATTADALIDAANRARTGASRLPQGQPTVAETKAALDDLQRQLAEIRRTATDTGEAFDAVRRQLDKDENTSRESKDEFSRLEREINQNLAEQARQVRDLARDAEQPQADSCAAAMAVSAALQAARSTMNVMRNGVQDLHAGQSRREAGASPVNAAAWRQIKAKIEDLVRTGQAGSYAEAERSIGRATGSGGLGGYAERQCDKFTGEWSGTTYVEALDKGEPFYGLQNDWTARVELAVARAVEGNAGADRPLRGTLSGRAMNFKVVNQLRTLYAGRPAHHIEFLTSEPSPAQQASATFVAVVEGFVRGNQMTLKIRPGGVDYAGRLTGKIAAVVIPMASPVPLVQTYDVVFQGGNWQLGRAVGPSGTPERPFPITVGGDKRIVQQRYPRTLSTAGARGRFTIDIRLCSGCD